jgi:hypothetical protein
MNNSEMPAMPITVKVDKQVITQAKMAGTHINTEHHFKGLTKREYFAAMAMQGLVAGSYGAETATAKEAVMLADLLLRELEADNV